MTETNAPRMKPYIVTLLVKTLKKTCAYGVLPVVPKAACCYSTKVFRSCGTGCCWRTH